MRNKTQDTAIIILFFFLTIFCCPPPSAFAEELMLTLDEAITLALRDNRSIRLQAQDVARIKAQLASDKSELWPTLTFAGTQQYDKGYYPADMSSTITQTSIRQYLYKGGSITNQIEKTKYDMQAAQAITIKARHEIILTVTKTFCATLLAQEYARLNKAIMDNTQQHLEFVSARYQKGLASENDVLRLKNSLENVTVVYYESLDQVSSLKAILRNVLYLENDIVLSLTGALAYEPRDFLYDESFLEALAGRPEIKEFEARERSGIKAVEIAKADGRPTIHASWDYYSRSHILSTASKNWNDNMVIGVTFSWPVFDGWGTKAKVDQAIADLKQAQLLKEKTIKDIALELKQAYLILKGSMSRLQAVEAELAWYENSIKKVVAQYEKGEASQLDLSDAQIGRDISIFKKTQATYDYLVAHADFLKATGGLQ